MFRSSYIISYGLYLILEIYLNITVYAFTIKLRVIIFVYSNIPIIKNPTEY